MLVLDYTFIVTSNVSNNFRNGEMFSGSLLDRAAITLCCDAHVTQNAIDDTISTDYLFPPSKKHKIRKRDLVGTPIA